MATAREHRISRMQAMGLSEAEAVIVDNSASRAAEAALAAGAEALSGLPRRLAGVAMAAFLGKLAGDIMVSRHDIAAAAGKGGLQ